MPKSYTRPVVFMGTLWIIFGLAANEWLIASSLSVERLSPQSRLFVWGVDIACILWGLATIKYRHLQLIADLNLLLLSSVFVLVFMEMTLRRFPGIAGRGFKNGIVSRYTTKSDGIYYNDPMLRMYFLLPNHRTVMQYNGYQWIHESDALGFRNPATLDRAEIMLLGDSFIYGHGLNVDQTVAHFLQQYSGMTVASLARQGDCSLQQAYLTTEYVPQLRPRYILYFFYENDLQDLYAFRTDAELQQFIETPLDEIRYSRMDPGKALKLRDDQNYAWSHSGSLLLNARERLYLAKATQWINLNLGRRQTAGTIDESHNDNNEESIAWRYTRHAIRYMNAISMRHGARLMIFPITPHNPNLLAALETFAAAEDILFIDSKSIHQGNSALFLPGDGHFSEEGAKVTARLAADFIQEHATPTPAVVPPETLR